VLAVAAFALLATMPLILPLLHLQLQQRVPASSHGVALVQAPTAPAAVSLPPVAQPIDPAQAPASLPSLNGAREAAAVASEDSRIRTMLHDSAHTYQPEVIPTRGALPTLVLTAGGKSSYDASDLIEYGALVRLPHHAALLLDNVFVTGNAQLSLGSLALQTLYLDNGSGGFASIVGWDGNLSFHGTDTDPLTILGWNRSVNSAATDDGDGRSYIREVAGKMTLTNTRVSDLGFWSGRTGGVAWTGLTGHPSTGSASTSTFTGNTYGAFVSRGSGVAFSDDLFEFNALDGLHIHRYSVGSSVTSSSASRNGGNGFTVSPATQQTTLDDDVSEHNAGNGYFINGVPLAKGASASGGSVAPGSGTAIEGSSALDNGGIGILVEGGTGTVIKSDQVCAAVTAVAIRQGAVNAVVTGNYVGCSPRSGLSLGPAVPGIMVSGNTVVGPRTGVLITSAGAVTLDGNHIVGATVFGVSARGSSSAVTGVGNVISGSGFRAVDARADASRPALSATDSSAWDHHSRTTFVSYLEFHPLAALWFGIAILVLAAWAWSHRRRLPAHPYPASTRWRAGADEAVPVDPPLTPFPGATTGPGPTEGEGQTRPVLDTPAAPRWPSPAPRPVQPAAAAAFLAAPVTSEATAWEVPEWDATAPLPVVPDPVGRRWRAGAAERNGRDVL
jgi:hypothetical protein